MKNSRNLLRIPSISSKSNRLKALAASTTPSALKLSTQFNQMKAPSPSSKRKLQRISNALGSFHDRSMTVTPPSCLLSMIMDGLYLSSADVAMNKEMMKSSDITHILNVSSGIGRVFPNVLSPPQIAYWLQFSSRTSLIFVERLQIFPLRLYWTILKSLMSSSIKLDDALALCWSTGSSDSQIIQLILISNQGISRSAAVVIAYLIYALSIPYEHAYCMVECVRPSIRPNNGFIYQLKKFQELSARHRLTWTLSSPPQSLLHLNRQPSSFIVETFAIPSPAVNRLLLMFCLLRLHSKPFVTTIPLHSLKCALLEWCDGALLQDELKLQGVEKSQNWWKTVKGGEPAALSIMSFFSLETLARSMWFSAPYSSSRPLCSSPLLAWAWEQQLQCSIQIDIGKVDWAHRGQSQQTAPTKCTRARGRGGRAGRGWRWNENGLGWYLRCLESVHHQHGNRQAKNIRKHTGGEVASGIHSSSTTQFLVKSEAKCNKDSWISEWVSIADDTCTQISQKQKTPTWNHNISQPKHGELIFLRKQITRKQNLDGSVKVFGNSDHHIRSKHPENIIEKQSRQQQHSRFEIIQIH